VGPLSNDPRLLEKLWDLPPLHEVTSRQRQKVEEAFRRHPKHAESPREALAEALEALLAELRRRPREWGKNETYLRGPHWARITTVAKYLADGRCLACGQKSFLQTHHHGIDTGLPKLGKYGRVGMERLADVTVLCSECHVAQEKREGTWKEPGAAASDIPF
jgi:hypothetical protein